MKDQINASKILYYSAINIQSMKFTRSLCKKLMIKCQMIVFLHLVQYHAKMAIETTIHLW